MKELFLLKNSKKNLEECVENFIEIIKDATNNTYMYPNIENLIPNKSIADLIIPLCNGDKNTNASELTAILLYTTQKTIYEKYSENFLAISLSEMYHYDRLSELIRWKNNSSIY